MRLFDLVEQHDLIGAAAHRFGERAALFITDIARRRADEACDAVLLHEFGHVDADHRIVVVEQETHSVARSEEHTSELQSLIRISYAVFCLKKKKNNTKTITT